MCNRLDGKKERKKKRRRGERTHLVPLKGPFEESDVESLGLGLVQVDLGSTARHGACVMGS
jgi:hypothetical protein